QAAVISWYIKGQANNVKLKIADGAGRDVREISGQLLANSGKPGIQSACWDLRVNPNPTAAPADGRGRGAAEAQGGSQSAAAGSAQPQSAFGPGCPAAAVSGAAGGFGAAPVHVGPFVVGGTYLVSLIVDGKTVDSKPLRVADDPEVVLTSVERKKLFDSAMEIHALQPGVTDAAAAHASLTRQVNELTSTIGSKTEIPADVKESFDAFKSELATMAPKFAVPAGRGF